MDPEVKEQILCQKAEWYKSLDPKEKENLLLREHANKQIKKTSVQHDLNHNISVFQSKIREGPYYICCVCNRLLYRKTVIELKKQKYTPQDLLTDIKSFNEKQYVCRTCNTKRLKGKVPCQAVSNKLIMC